MNVHSGKSNDNEEAANKQKQQQHSWRAAAEAEAKAAARTRAQPTRMHFMFAVVRRIYMIQRDIYIYIHISSACVPLP